MAYDEELADRLRERFATTAGVTEMRMFGGLAFLVRGRMAVCASREGGLLLRCDPARTESYLGDSHVGRFVMRGKEMDGWLRVDAPAVADDVDLDRWMAVGVDYAMGLPPKT